MKAITPGHKYALSNKENPSEFQVISFINKSPKIHGQPELYVVHDGTTTEEVLEMCLDRLTHLNNRVADDYNSSAIIHLATVIKILNERTASREKRNVEGTEKA